MGTSIHRNELVEREHELLNLTNKKVVEHASLTEKHDGGKRLACCSEIKRLKGVG